MRGWEYRGRMKARLPEAKKMDEAGKIALGGAAVVRVTSACLDNDRKVSLGVALQWASDRR